MFELIKRIWGRPARRKERPSLFKRVTVDERGTVNKVQHPDTDPNVAEFNRGRLPCCGATKYYEGRPPVVG